MAIQWTHNLSGLIPCIYVLNNQIGDRNMLEQLSVFVENKVGSLYRVTSVLKENDINIRAVATFDAPEFGILRMVVDKPQLAKEKLMEKNFLVKLTNVIAVNLEDRPGELDRVLGVIAEAGLNLNYVYSFVIRNEKTPLMVMNIDDLEIATQILTENGVKVETSED